jgi:hypothetical protein
MIRKSRNYIFRTGENPSLQCVVCGGEETPAYPYCTFTVFTVVDFLLSQPYIPQQTLASHRKTGMCGVIDVHLLCQYFDAR